MCIKCRIREAIKTPRSQEVNRDNAIGGLGMVLAELMMHCTAEETASVLGQIEWHREFMLANTPQYDAEHPSKPN